MNRTVEKQLRRKHTRQRVPNRKPPDRHTPGTVYTLYMPRYFPTVPITHPQSVLRQRVKAKQPTQSEVSGHQRAFDVAENDGDAGAQTLVLVHRDHVLELRTADQLKLVAVQIGERRGGRRHFAFRVRR